MANRAMLRVRSAIDGTPRLIIVRQRGRHVHFNDLELTASEALELASELVDIGTAIVLREAGWGRKLDA